MAEHGEPVAHADVEQELRAVDALVDHVPGDKIWAVLEYARAHAISVARACEHVLGAEPPTTAVE